MKRIDRPEVIGVAREGGSKWPALPLSLTEVQSMIKRMTTEPIYSISVPFKIFAYNSN